MDVLERTTARETFEFFDGADTDDFLSVVRNPDRDRVTPESVSGKAPIS